MSITGNYRRIRPEELELLLREPERILPFFGHEPEEEDGEYDEEAETESEERYYAFKDALKEAGREIWIDKGWAGLHYLVNGSALLNSVTLSPHRLGNVEVGYGTATYLTADEVEDVSRALARLTEEGLRRQFAPDAMNAAKVYPVAPRYFEWGLESFPWLMKTFTQVRDFFRLAADNGEAMLLWLS
jgi:hypothetical protein